MKRKFSETSAQSNAPEHTWTPNTPWVGNYTICWAFIEDLPTHVICHNSKPSWMPKNWLRIPPLGDRYLSINIFHLSRLQNQTKTFSSWDNTPPPQWPTQALNQSLFGFTSSPKASTKKRRLVWFSPNSCFMHHGLALLDAFWSDQKRQEPMFVEGFLEAMPMQIVKFCGNVFLGSPQLL